MTIYVVMAETPEPDAIVRLVVYSQDHAIADAYALSAFKESQFLAERKNKYWKTLPEVERDAKIEMLKSRKDPELEHYFFGDTGYKVVKVEGLTKLAPARGAPKPVRSGPPVVLCGICKKPMDVPGDSMTLNCGGDCFRCSEGELNGGPRDDE